MKRFLILLLLASGLMPDACPLFGAPDHPDQVWNYIDASGVSIPFRFGIDSDHTYDLTFPASVTVAQQNEVLALTRFNNTAYSGVAPTVATGALFPAGSVNGFIQQDIPETLNFTVTVAQMGAVFQVTTGAGNITATLPAAATAGDGFYIFLRKVDTAAGVVLTSPTTSPAATSVAVQGAVSLVWTDGTSYYERPWVGSVDTTGDLTLSSPGFISLSPLSTVDLGPATSATPAASYTFQSTAGVGTNIVASNLVIQPGASTGSGNPATFTVNVTNVGVGGTTAQTQAPVISTSTAGQLTLQSQGTNQNLVLTPSGSGATTTAGNISISKAQPKLSLTDSGTSWSAIIFSANGGAQLTNLGNESSAGGTLGTSTSAYASVFGSVNNKTQLISGGKLSLTSDTNQNLQTVGTIAVAGNPATHLYNNFATAGQTPAATTRTVITGSGFTFPAGAIQVGTVLHWQFDLTKTAAGTAASTIDIAFGTAGTTADTAQVSFTKPAGTAAGDEGTVIIEAVVKTNSATGVVLGNFQMTHNLASTGHMVIPVASVETTSGAFNTATPTNIELCITTGASDSITINQVSCYALNL